MPFIPTKSGLHTDLVARQGFCRPTRAAHGLPAQKLVVMPDPFDGDGEADGGDLVLLPALTPDLTVLHVQTVGDDGTVRIKGLTFADLEQAERRQGGRRDCEEIVPAATLRADPDQNAPPVPGRRHRVRAARRPPHRLPLLLRLRPRLFERLRARRARRPGRPFSTSGSTAWPTTTSTWPGSAPPSSRASRPTRCAATPSDWTGGEAIGERLDSDAQRTADAQPLADAQPVANTQPFTPREMMAIAAGRFCSDGDILFAGTGVALLAAGCAKRIHAPGAVVFVETGGIDPSLDEIPLAVADSRVMDGTCINAGSSRRSRTSPARGCTRSPFWEPPRSTSTAI